MSDSDDAQRLIDALEMIHARANHAANTCDTARAALRAELATIAALARTAIYRCVKMDSAPL